jgi:DNA gyrase subunit A
MIITISISAITTYRINEFHTQNRGGVGAKGSETRDEDFVNTSSATCTLYVVFYQKGKCIGCEYHVNSGRNEKLER